MTVAERLAKGRQQAAERRRAEDEARLAAYRGWLVREAATFATYRDKLSAFGAGDSETRSARREWRKVMSDIPQLPPDSAFARARGDLAYES